MVLTGAASGDESQTPLPSGPVRTELPARSGGDDEEEEEEEEEGDDDDDE